MHFGMIFQVVTIPQYLLFELALFVCFPKVVLVSYVKGILWEKLLCLGVLRA